MSNNTIAYLETPVNQCRIIPVYSGGYLVLELEISYDIPFEGEPVEPQQPTSETDTYGLEAIA